MSRRHVHHPGRLFRSARGAVQALHEDGSFDGRVRHVALQLARPVVVVNGHIWCRPRVPELVQRPHICGTAGVKALLNRYVRGNKPCYDCDKRIFMIIYKFNVKESCILPFVLICGRGGCGWNLHVLQTTTIIPGQCKLMSTYYWTF